MLAYGVGIAPLDADDLRGLQLHRVGERRIDPAEVEQEDAGVVPATPRGQPVDGEQLADLDGDAELFVDLPCEPGCRSLADLDHAAGKVPLTLVRELAEQDA